MSTLASEHAVKHLKGDASLRRAAEMLNERNNRITARRALACAIGAKGGSQARFALASTPRRMSPLWSRSGRQRIFTWGPERKSRWAHFPFSAIWFDNIPVWIRLA